MLGAQYSEEHTSHTISDSACKYNISLREVFQKVTENRL